MKKEKTIRTYQRRTKTGKLVTVRQHTAKYDAAEALKEAAKKKGAGDELEKLKKKPKEDKVPNLIDDANSPWNEFENNFEEGWGGNSSVFCLANHEHHREVANLAAYNLSKKYDGNKFYQRKDWETLAQKAYNEAAKKLYPKEKLWSGDNEDNPAFWHEHLTAGGSKKSAIKQLWRKEWGSFDSFGKKSTVKKAKKSPKETAASSDAGSYGFTPDEYKAWYHWDQDADPKNKSALKVEKALKKQMGTKAYNKYFDEMSDSYSSRGHNKAFKGLSEKFSTGDGKKSVTPSKDSKKSTAGVTDGASAVKYNGKTYMVTRDGSVETITGRKVGKALTDKILSEKSSKSVSKGKETKADSSEYGKVPKHLGMTQQEWNDWMDGGAGYKKADKKAKVHLEKLYGKEGARYIQQKYEQDGSNKYIDLVSSNKANKGVLSEISEYTLRKKDYKGPKKVSADGKTYFIGDDGLVTDSRGRKVGPRVSERVLKTQKSSKSVPKEYKDSSKGHPKVMAQIDKLTSYYQKEIEKIQKHIDAGERSNSRMSYKQQKKYAEGLISKLEKGRDAHLSGKENRAWHYLREFVGFNENNVIGKETRAKNKVAAEKKGIASLGIPPKGSKNKSTSKQDKAAKDAGFNSYAEMKAHQDYSTAKNLLKKKSTKGDVRKQLEKEVSNYEKKPSKKKESSDDLRKRADAMDASAARRASKTSVKKLTEQGYTKYRYGGETFYHKGKSGSLGGSYKVIDSKGRIVTAYPYQKEYFKEKIAKVNGKTYKMKNVR